MWIKWGGDLKYRLQKCCSLPKCVCVCIFWKYTKRNLLHFMSIVWRGWETANSDSCREINFYCFSFSLMHFSTRPVFSFALTNSHIRICMPHAKCPITSFNNMHAYVKWTIIFESHGRTNGPSDTCHTLVQSIHFTFGGLLQNIAKWRGSSVSVRFGKRGCLLVTEAA